MDNTDLVRIQEELHAQFPPMTVDGNMMLFFLRRILGPNYVFHYLGRPIDFLRMKYITFWIDTQWGLHMWCWGGVATSLN